jgi:hypothetical protein
MCACVNVCMCVRSATKAALSRVGAGLTVMWGGTLVHLDDLPFPVAKLPDTFSQFRYASVDCCFAIILRFPLFAASALLCSCRGTNLTCIVYFPLFFFSPPFHRTAVEKKWTVRDQFTVEGPLKPLPPLDPRDRPGVIPSFVELGYADNTIPVADPRSVLPFVGACRESALLRPL